MKKFITGETGILKRSGIKATILGFATLSTVVAGAENLLENGDFELGKLSPWVGDGAVSNALWDVDGLHAAKIDGILTQTITVEPYRTYRLSATVMANDG